MLRFLLQKLMVPPVRLFCPAPGIFPACLSFFLKTVYTKGKNRQGGIPMTIQELTAAQRAFFRTGATLDLSFRKRALDKL